jgi:hypothetical protein
VSTEDLGERARAAFEADVAAAPRMTLRGGAAVDSYDEPSGFDPRLDQTTDAYLEAYAYWALPHLDPISWRHYLPSLRPPDRDPPRLASLSAEQERVVVAVLDVLAFDARSVHRDFAMQVLEEYWVPGALYRNRAAGADDGGSESDSQPPPRAR